MASNEYAFLTRWRVRATPDEVAKVLARAEDLPRWWPSVYLKVRVLEPGDARGIGRKVELHTKGWLPYTLTWTYVVTRSEPPHHWEIEAQGDLEGRGVWDLRADGDHTEIVYDWRIRAEKGVLKHLSFALKPFFAANHHWAMEQGLESLKLELLRQRAQSETARQAVAHPPPAVSKLHAAAHLLTPLGPLKLARRLTRSRR